MSESAPVLERREWEAVRQAHRSRVDELIGPHLRRRRRGERHPVLDFLFTYYSLRPNRLRQWDPGFGITLEDADEYAQRRGYRRCTDGVCLDPAFVVERGSTVDFIARLLEATAARPAQLSCFGLHEWAMVYRSDETRHRVPLRLGGGGTDAVVEALPLRCTHFDAYRFFTPEAVPRNATALSRQSQVAAEQPGCLHATMDLYKWCYKLSPLVDSALLLDCLDLAVEARELDMRASPYDLTAYGYRPIAIETASGRAEYVRAQTAVARRGEVLRARLLERCRALSAAANRPEAH